MLDETAWFRANTPRTPRGVWRYLFVKELFSHMGVPYYHVRRTASWSVGSKSESDVSELDEEKPAS